MRLDDIPLGPRGTASIECLASTAAWLGASTREIDRELRRRLAGTVLPTDLDELAACIEPVLESMPLAHTRAALHEWQADHHGRLAVDAFEEIADTVVPALLALDDGPATLERDLGQSVPEYWRDVWFHRTWGGWEGHPYMGFVHGEIVHKRQVARSFPGAIFRQRREVAALAPRRDYARILELGASSGHYTLALAETFPAAEVHGIDLSIRMLEHSRRVANERGLAWRLAQRPAEATGYDDAYFDLVTSYILLHELPAAAVRATFQEAMRVLAPGGDLLMSDVTRYADLDPIARWWADHGARRGGEPYWRESASLDLPGLARECGFVDVSVHCEAPARYPYVVVARKPHGARA